MWTESSGNINMILYWQLSSYWQFLAVTAFTVAVLEYCTLLLAVTVIGSDTYVIYDPIFTVHIQQTYIQHTNVS